MNVQDIVTRVRSQFGDSTGIQVSDQDIFNWINDGMRDICYTANLIETRASADVKTGQEDYNWPDDVLTVFNVKHNGIVLTSLTIQERDTFLENADTLTVQQTESTPTHYWIWANTITLYPTPSSDLQSGLVAYYTRTAVKVTNISDSLDSKFPLSFHNTLLDKVLQWAYEKDENWQAAQIKEGQYTVNVNKLAEDASFNEHEAYPHITTSERDAGDSGLGNVYGNPWW